MDWKEWATNLAAFYNELLRSSPGRANQHLFDLRKAFPRGLTADLAGFGISLATLLSNRRLRLELMEPEPEQADLLAELEDEEENQEEGEGSEVFIGEDQMEGRQLDPGAVRAIRKIYRKQRGDPHNRETVLGLPILGVKAGGALFTGPLFLWEVDLDYNPATRVMTVEKKVDSPNLNATLLSKIGTDSTEVDLIRDKLLPLLTEGTFDEGKLNEALRTLSGTLELLSRLPTSQVDEDLGSYLQEVRSLDSRCPARLLMRAALSNGPRSYAFLLEDLEKIANLAIHQVGSETVLSQVVGNVPEEGIGEIDSVDLPFSETSDGGQPLWFPFPSNPSQRSVAQKAARARILTVQGPPGTGKSLTIANMICHLVTEGKTVLVTSHQQKAMEVVSKMLQHMEGLAMSVLRGDKESMAQLRTRLAAVEENQGDSLRAREEFVAGGEERVHELDRELRALTRRYNELKELERDRYPTFSKYAELRELDRIHADDRPDHNSAPEVAAALREWAKLYGLFHPYLSEMEKLFQPDGPDTPRSAEQDVADRIGDLIEIARTTGSPVKETAKALVADLLERHSAASDVRGLLEDCSRYVGHVLPGLASSIRSLGQDPSEESVVAGWRTASANRPDDWDKTFDGLTAAESFFLNSELVGGELERKPTPKEAIEVKRLVRILRTSRGAFFTWFLSPTIRRAKKDLHVLGFPAVGRVTLSEDLELVSHLLEWHQRFESLSENCEAISTQLPPNSLSVRLREKKNDILAYLERFRTAGVVMRGIQATPMLVLDSTAHVLGNDGLTFEESFLSRATETLENARLWLLRKHTAEAFRGSLTLHLDWKDRVERLLQAIEAGELDQGSMKNLDDLEGLHQAYPHFERLLDLQQVELAGLENTLFELREGIRQTGEAPTWLVHAETALEAHRLGGLIRGSLSTDPDDLSEIARRLQQGQAKRREMLGTLVQQKRALAVAKSLDQPRVYAPLLTLKNLLNRRRLTDSLLAVRKDIDYQAVLRVFPCWICTIDDAARIFPLEAGLFDVLIVDEASQCSQSTFLPLAYRARSMIIVGDEKQLQPAESRFISSQTVSMLQAKHRIAEHPKRAFLDGKASLLNLAEVCSNARTMLDEHFRCDPAIIRWSNQRYYNNRLKILTHRRRDRAIIPLEVKVLMEADDDPETKVNRLEAETVVREARRLVESGEAEGQSIGVLSPFRKQATFIDGLLQKEFAGRPEALKSHEIVSSTADGFQGDERDIILYSFRFGPSSRPGSISAIQMEEERLNVAFTRARKRCVSFISSPQDRFPDGPIRSFIEHSTTEQNRARNPEIQPGEEDRFDSQFEREVCNALRDRGLRVTTQYPCGPYRIDLVVEDDEGRILAVECDGEWKEDEFGFLRPEDYQREDIIERAGWTVHRISGRKWLLNPVRELDVLVGELASQPTLVLPLPSAADLEEAQEALRQAQEEVGPMEVSELAADPTLEDSLAQGELILTSKGPVSPPSPQPPEQARFLGDNWQTWMDTLGRLIRWTLIGRPSVDTRVVDPLTEAREAVLSGRALTSFEIDRLREIWQWARAVGFDPNEWTLPS